MKGQRGGGKWAPRQESSKERCVIVWDKSQGRVTKGGAKGGYGKLKEVVSAGEEESKIHGFAIQKGQPSQERAGKERDEGVHRETGWGEGGEEKEG